MLFRVMTQGQYLLMRACYSRTVPAHARMLLKDNTCSCARVTQGQYLLMAGAFTQGQYLLMRACYSWTIPAHARVLLKDNTCSCARVTQGQYLSWAAEVDGEPAVVHSMDKLVSTLAHAGRVFELTPVSHQQVPEVE